MPRDGDIQISLRIFQEAINFIKHVAGKCWMNEPVTCWRSSISLKPERDIRGQGRIDLPGRQWRPRC
jgi:hypothetical protein